MAGPDPLVRPRDRENFVSPGAAAPEVTVRHTCWCPMVWGPRETETADLSHLLPGPWRPDPTWPPGDPQTRETSVPGLATECVGRYGFPEGGQLKEGPEGGSSSAEITGHMRTLGDPGEATLPRVGVPFPASTEPE